MASSGTDALTVQVILGSTRQGRIGDRVAQWFLDVAGKRDDANVELVDLRDHPLPFFDSEFSPKHSISDDPRIQRWAATVERADAFVLVTPEYNFGYPAVLKNALDHLYYQWNDKPVSFVGYGGISGGMRAVQQLRQVVVELGMVQTHAQVTIPRVRGAFDDEGHLTDPMLAAMAPSVMKELVEWAHVLRLKERTPARRLDALAPAR